MGIVVVTMVILLIELTAGPQSLTPQVLTIPPEVAAIFQFIQANFVGSFVFVLLTAVLWQLKEARRALQKKHSREGKLNKTLTKQKQSLELEQRLSRKLISNIPRPHPPHPQPVGSGPWPHAREDEWLEVGERPTPDAPHPGKRRPPRAPSCRPHSAQERALWGW